MGFVYSELMTDSTITNYVSSKITRSFIINQVYWILVFLIQTPQQEDKIDLQSIISAMTCSIQILKMELSRDENHRDLQMGHETIEAGPFKTIITQSLHPTLSSINSIPGISPINLISATLSKQSEISKRLVYWLVGLLVVIW
ncbi:hypothetical protein MJO29_015744 [Puccinia striiformis f. sp. tritici]|nr:hypothetical protein MJO29_015744 [Puccinia striiformis f. sp. tritici]